MNLKIKEQENYTMVKFQSDEGEEFKVTELQQDVLVEVEDSFLINDLLCHLKPKLQAAMNLNKGVVIAGVGPFFVYALLTDLFSMTPQLPWVAVNDTRYTEAYIVATSGKNTNLLGRVFYT